MGAAAMQRWQGSSERLVGVKQHPWQRGSLLTPSRVGGPGEARPGPRKSVLRYPQAFNSLLFP